MEVNSLPYWPRQIRGPYGVATQVPPFSAAASSGFPTTSTLAPSTAVGQPHFPNTAIEQAPFFAFNHPHLHHIPLPLQELKPVPGRT